MPVNKRKKKMAEFTVKKIENGKAHIAEWVDGCHSCAVDLATGNIVAYVTVDGYGEWCGVRPLSDEEKDAVFAGVQNFLANKESKENRQARAIANARKAGITADEMSDGMIPAYWADKSAKEIIADYCEGCE